MQPSRPPVANEINFPPRMVQWNELRETFPALLPERNTRWLRGTGGCAPLAPRLISDNPPGSSESSHAEIPGYTCQRGRPENGFFVYLNCHANCTRLRKIASECTSPHKNPPYFARSFPFPRLRVGNGNERGAGPVSNTACRAETK